MSSMTAWYSWLNQIHLQGDKEVASLKARHLASQAALVAPPGQSGVCNQNLVIYGQTCYTTSNDGGRLLVRSKLG
jgi:hypothetical protein